MFQYIADILKSISPQKRLMALFVLLLFILLITLGGRIISAVSSSDTVLENKIERLERANVLLNNQNKELQVMILESQIQCTKDITQVRKQIIDELSEIEMEMSGPPRAMRTMSSRDTVRARAMVVQVPETNPQAMNHVRSLKNKLQEDIKEEK